ncbi:hypothetical protein [Trichlorobacter lovleyi]|uniref:hypothetical protein n=1 Tax=Trichlorobacter lovleyi TaxID=313985 RepID=UPI003D125F8D
MKNDQSFEINHAADLEKLGKMVSEAIEYHDDKDYDSTRDMLLELHNQIYPNACRRLTPEETEAYYAEARKEPAVGYEAQGYRPLMLDEADIPVHPRFAGMNGPPGDLLVHPRKAGMNHPVDQTQKLAGHRGGRSPGRHKLRPVASGY